MFKFLVSIATIFPAVYSQDPGSKVCAWNRAIPPGENENLAATVNFINGEFVRDVTSFTSRNPPQTVLFNDVAYYKMAMTRCYVPVLYLFRFVNTTVYPARNTWVIAANVGTLPKYGYAYCIAASVDQDTPYGACDNNWMVGEAGRDNHVLDVDFKVMLGGCPQVTCQSLLFSAADTSAWAFTYNILDSVYQSTFTYDQPNIYLYTEPGNGPFNSQNNGKWYLFWNPKVWRWAINEYIANGDQDYNNCEQYKRGRGFTNVADVKPGDYSRSVKEVNQMWYYSADPVRYIKCLGTQPTPQPTSEGPAVPTIAPTDKDYCGVQWNQVSPSFQETLDYYCAGTPSPVHNIQFTNDPTESPIPPDQPTESPTSRPTRAPVTPTTPPPTVPPGSPSRAPTKKPSSSPSVPTSPPPTVPPGSPSRAPSQIQVGGDGTDGDGDGDGDDAVIRVNCNVYLVCVMVALYKLLF